MIERQLILASASERRKNILNDLCVSFEIVIPAVEEVFYKDDPYRTASENALLKNKWSRKECAEAAIITADTIIDFHGSCITKPADMREAEEFLKTFSGKSQDILTAVGFSTPGSDPEVVVVRSSVEFKLLNSDDIKKYFIKVNPLDKAGAYDINQHSELIINNYSGSYSNIMGLPKETVVSWLKQEGYIK